MSSQTKTKTRRRQTARRGRNVRRSSRQQTDRSSRRRKTTRRSSRRNARTNPFRNEDGSWDRAAIMRYAHSFAADMHYPHTYSDRLGEALTVTWRMAKQWPRAQHVDPHLHADRLHEEAHAYEEEEDGVEYLEPEILRENGWSGAVHHVNEYKPSGLYAGPATTVHVYDRKLKRRDLEWIGSGGRTWHVHAEKGVEKQQHEIEIEYMTLTLTLRTSSHDAAVEAWATLTESRVCSLWSLLHSCRPDSIFDKRAKREGRAKQRRIAAMLGSRLGDCSVEFDGVIVL